MGNPLSYRDGMTFEWANGRNLQSITNGNETITMQYNANGMRTRQDNDDYTLHYYYDSNNNLTGLNFNGLALYFYNMLSEAYISIGKKPYIAAMVVYMYI